MCTDGLCSDPVDISLLILKIFSKVCEGNKFIIIYGIRAVISLFFDALEVYIFTLNVTGGLIEDGDDSNLGLILILVITVLSIFGFVGIGMIILNVLLGLLHDKTDDAVKKRKNIIFVMFKVINIVFAAALGGLMIYKKDEIDLSKGEHIFLIVCVGMDAVFDPIELLIGGILMCRS